MNTQKVSVFKQKNNKGLTALAIIACLLLSPALYIALFLPQVLAAVPVALLALLGYAGPLSATVCAGMLAALSTMIFGVGGGVMVALLIVPTVLVAAVMLDREQPFWLSVAAGGVAMFASLGVVVAALSVIMGNDVVSALMQIVENTLATTGGMGDMLLSILLQTGVITAPQGVDMGALQAGEALALDPQAREQLVRSLTMVVDSVMRLELPMQIATGSVTAGLLGQAVLRKGMLSRGIKVDYPRLKTWHIPRGWGRILGGTLVVLYLLAMLVPQSMNTMFYVFSGVFDKVFALQGIAAVCFMIDRRGGGRVWQRVVFVAGYFFLGSLAMAVGIFDQAMDFAKRRDALDKEVNPFDPRKED